MELDASKPLELEPGAFYAGVASVKATHPEATIRDLLTGNGLSVYDYAEQGQRPGLGPDPSRGYRYVAVMVQAARAGKLPTSVPFPLSMFDESRAVRLWELQGEAPGANIAPAPPAPGAPAPRPEPSPWPVVGALAVVALGGTVKLPRKRRRKG